MAEVTDIRIAGLTRPLDDVLEEIDLAELRAAVNNTRSCLRGLHKLARAANALVADLEDRLEHYDTVLQRIHRAQEAQHAQEASHTRIAPV